MRWHRACRGRAAPVGPVVLVAVALALAGVAPAGPSGAAAVVPGPGEAWRTFRPPTDGPVLDPYRPPAQPWLPGNRGIEYATRPGTTLVAIGPGIVTFAGSVAGRLVVSVAHPGGLRSSLTGVASIEAEVGVRVWAGAPIATAGERVHLGVRRGEAYLDPASLWGTAAGPGSVHLVPIGPAPPTTTRSPTLVAGLLARSPAVLAW